MTKDLRAQESTLFDLLRPGVEMAMPHYQRSYSWEESEVKDLLSDLLRVGTTGKAHFIGAIVLVRQETGRLLIVDGQQRLATLTKLLCVLRDHEDSEENANALHSLIADEENSILDNGIVWRMSLNHIDGPFFQEAVQMRGATLRNDIEPSESDSQKCIVKNKALLVKAVRNMSVEKRRQLAEIIQHQLILVRVIVPEGGGGYDVFKVLNTRGKAPNNHDIIKTELLEKANLPREEADVLSLQWSEHEALLGGAGLDHLLNHIRELYTRNPKAGLDGFRKAVLSKVDARDFLTNELPGYVKAYAMITSPKTEFPGRNEAIQHKLRQLRLIDHNLWRAPAIKFLTAYNGNPQSALEFFTKLERLAYAMMLVVTERNQRLKRYGRIAEATDKPQLLLSDRGPMALSRDEKRKLESRLLGRFGSFSQRRAIALRLNAAIEGGNVFGSENGATVEHVLPRNLPEDSPWHNSWPSPDVHRELCETMGNFVLLSQKANEKADNGSFEEKKALYFENGDPEYALTRDLEDQVTWTPEIVRTRTARLAKILSDDWDL